MSQYGVRRNPIRHHRIQAGRAIISLTLARGSIGDGGYLLEWVGDAYELRSELDAAISELERKYRLTKKEKSSMETAQFQHQLGAEARDKVTGFTGIITGRIEYMFGCNQYGISPKVGEDGKPGETHYFDEGRIEILSAGIAPEEVQVGKPGGINRDAPRS